MENKNIYQKLLASQREIGAITKTQDNPFFHSKYADINAILAVVKPILNKNGLLLTQGVRMQNDGVDAKMGIKTEIRDVESKDYIADFCVIPTMSDPQKTGSAITYFRRYALQSLLALEAQDDDGNTASQTKETKKGVDKKAEKLDKEFMKDLEPTDEEVVHWQWNMEACRDVKELQRIWKEMPPMVQEKLENQKNDLKLKLI